MRKTIKKTKARKVPLRSRKRGRKTMERLAARNVKRAVEKRRRAVAPAPLEVADPLSIPAFLRRTGPRLTDAQVRMLTAPPPWIMPSGPYARESAETLS